MITAIDLSILILITGSLLVLILDAIGTRQFKLGNIEKPHIELVAISSILTALFIIFIDFLSIQKITLFFHSKIGPLFLILNTLVFILLYRNNPHRKSDQAYFIILSSLAISIFNISTTNLIFKLAASCGWMVLVTTLAIISTPGGKKAEIGLKLSFSSLL